MDINYTIKFHTYWHCGSGLAAGGDADLLVVKDKDGVPFVPGKTIKGLVREAVDLLFLDKISKDVYKSVFGVTAKNKESRKYMKEQMMARGFKEDEVNKLLKNVDKIIDQVMELAKKYPTMKEWQEKAIKLLTSDKYHLIFSTDVAGVSMQQELWMPPDLS